MKKLIIINGTMGVGKSTVCQILLDKLTPGVYLDGDWCWNMNPFVVSEENKTMVLDNITHLLKNYLSNSSYQYVIFCWVIHQEDIFKQLLTPLESIDFELHKISLVCSESVLRNRLEYDVLQGSRTSDVINRSILRLPLYNKMDTVKIDVSELSPSDTAKRICRLVK
jgi:broad-specificity NMP kinase